MRNLISKLSHCRIAKFPHLHSGILAQLVPTLRDCRIPSSPCPPSSTLCSLWLSTSNCLSFKFPNWQISKLVILLLISTSAFAQTSPRPLPPAYNPAAPVNYVRTWDMTSPETTSGNITNIISLAKAHMTTQYVDGLGRPFQTVVKQASMITGSDPLDMVSAVEYDPFGREQFKYLPFQANASGGNPSLNDGMLKLNPFQQQAAFFDNANPLNPIKGQGETFFYGQTVFDASPANRPQQSLSPGNSWIGNGVGASSHYWQNTDKDVVQLWNVDETGDWSFGIYSTTSVYPAGQLYKSIMVDEHGSQVIEFKDNGGKVILKKVQLTASPDDGTGQAHDGWLCTYYIYDDFHRLRAVIQPEAVKQMSDQNDWTTTAWLDEQCFRYEYDERGRMRMKKVPGAAAVYMIYDARDRLVMTQDGNLRQDKHGWLITRYDDLNRPIQTGMITSDQWFDEPYKHQDLASLSTSYPAQDYLNTYNWDLLTETHYDDYQNLPNAYFQSTLVASGYATYFLTTYNTAPYYAQQPVQSLHTNGLPTWTRTKVLGSNSQYLSALNIYDDKGRVIQVQSFNIGNGIDISTTQYDFSGKVLFNHLSHTVKNPYQQYAVVTHLSYDALGRLSTTEKKVASSPWHTTSAVSYNALGRAQTKKIGIDQSGTPLETLDYDYNIRGWLLGMNRDFLAGNTGGKRFGFELAYDKPSSAFDNYSGSTYNAPQLNGNIGGIMWRSIGDGENRKYDFGYDAANRLLKGDFTQYTSSAWNQDAGVVYDVKMGDGNDPLSAYDANGNILAMNQWGLKLGSSTTIDKLTYHYYAHSNKLQMVEDGANDFSSKLGDFKYDPSLLPKSPGDKDYGYDVNGNMITDRNKNLGSATGIDITTGGAITYNYLNLPERIVVSNKGEIFYTYDATGAKLQKLVKEDNASVPFNGSNYTTTINTITHYIGGFIYESKHYSDPALASLNYDYKLQFLGNEEGRIRPSWSGALMILDLFNYDYFIKDHLGNVRMVLTDERKVDKYPTATLEDAKIQTEQNFYSINTGQVVDASSVSGLTSYTNDNGIGDNPEDATFQAANSQKLYKINSATTPKTGLGITLRVMNGDRIDIFGKSYYFQNNTGGSVANSSPTTLEILQGLLGTPTGGITNQHGAVDASQLDGFPGVAAGILSLFSNQTNDNNQYTTKPKAYINYIFFDEQFKVVSTGFSPVGANSTLKDHHSELQNILAPKNGYVYIYCSNESPVSVYFDNLQVVHTRGAILEETHYYPFGLTMAGISSKAASSIHNKLLFLDKEIQSGEFSDGSGLEEYDLGARFYDPQIGRFYSLDPLEEYMRRWSPYSYAFNNPVRFEDGTGMAPGDSENNPIVLPEVVVTAKKKNDNGWFSSVGSFLNHAVDFVPFAGSIKQIGLGIYHGDWKEVGMGVVFLAVDAVTAGEGGELLHLGEAAVEDVLKVGAEDEVKEIAEKNLAEAAETEWHHSDPKFMGGEKKQGLTEMEKGEHKQLHKDLNEHLKGIKDSRGNHMRPQKGNSGATIRKNFTREQRIQAMKDFYKGPGANYAPAAKDFFKQHP